MRTTKSKGFWLGVDVGAEKLEAAVSPAVVQPTDWRQLPTRAFANTAEGLADLVNYTVGQIGANGRLAGICAESTGPLSRRLAERLATAQPQWPAASIINPKRSVDFGRSAGVRDKSDRIDAAILAVYGAIYKPAPKTPPAEGYLQLRDLYRAREQLLLKMQDLMNMRWAHDNAVVLQVLQQAVDGLAVQVKALEKAAAKIIEETQTLKNDLSLLTSIRGIKFMVAWALLAELGDLRNYTRAEIVAFVGIYPRQHDSGKTVHLPPRLVKGGCRRVRKALYNAARALFRSKNNTLRSYLDRLLARGKKPMQCIAALMRKLLLIARSVLSLGIPYNPFYSQGGR